MNHRASPRFWLCYHGLPEEVQQAADRAYQLLCADARHPSLHFKKIGAIWTVRVGLHHRAVAVEDSADMIWVWIGSHAEYDRLVRSRA